jgi:hypothetical protein
LLANNFQKGDTVERRCSTIFEVNVQEKWKRQSPPLPETIALALAAGTAMRLTAAPAVTRLADRFNAPRALLALCSAAAGLIVHHPHTMTIGLNGFC